MDARDQLLTKKEVADLMRVTPRTINRWMEEGALKPAMRIRHTIRFRRGDVLIAAERYFYNSPNRPDPAMG